MIEPYCPYGPLDDPEMFGLERKVVASRFGEQLVIGTPTMTSPTVRILLHGVGGGWLSWTPVLQQLKAEGVKTGDVLIPDLPGFGKSQNILSELPAKDVGNYLIDYALSEGWQKIELIGHSMGGFLALDMAAGGRPEIGRVSILAGAYFSVVDTANNPIASLRRHSGTAISYLSMSLLARTGQFGTRLMERLARSGMTKPLLQRMVAHSDLMRPDASEYILTNLRPRPFQLAARNGRGYNADEEWGRITIPVRALFGDRDHLVPPADARRLEMALPRAVITMLPDTGHFANFERPGLVATYFFVES